MWEYLNRVSSLQVTHQCLFCSGGRKQCFLVMSPKCPLLKGPSVASIWARAIFSSEKTSVDSILLLLYLPKELISWSTTNWSAMREQDLKTEQVRGTKLNTALSWPTSTLKQQQGEPHGGRPGGHLGPGRTSRSSFPVSSSSASSDSLWLQLEAEPLSYS